MTEIHNLFYCSRENITQNQILIEGPEFNHIKNVLRRQEGDIIFFTDGKGNRYKTEIARINRKKICARILQKEYIPLKRDLHLDLGFVPLKGQRSDYIIEKGTELGIMKFVIFFSQNSSMKQISNLKLTHFQNIAISAMLQSRRYYLPEITFLGDFASLTNHFHNYDAIFIAAESGKKVVPIYGNSVFYIVGPEGGFTKEELNILREKGAELISLGENRLRSETAAVVGIVKILSFLKII